MNTSRLLCLVLLLLAAVSVRAAKVVRLFNAWPDSAITFQMVGGWDGVNWNGVDVKGNEVTLKGQWYEKVLPSTWSPTSSQNKVRYSSAGWKYNFGAKGFGDQTDMDIASVLKTSDTVWIVPAPLPSGAAVLAGTRPKMTTVMFWSPWLEDAQRRRPSFKAESQAWVAMKQDTASGWYSATVLGYTHLDVVFRNQDSSVFFGQTGVGPLPLPMRLDTATRNDTVWVRAAKETSGVPVVSSSPPAPKVLMVFNPWDGAVPVVRPLVSLDGGAFFDIPYSRGYCGWYQASWFERKGQVLLKSSDLKQSYGAEGIGSTKPIDVSAILASNDTVWVSPTSVGARPPRIGGLYSGDRGVCMSMLLAATFRDFADTDSSFEHKNQCGNGMVTGVLGPDRKPVPNSKANTCNLGDSARMVDTWFKDVPAVNATTCRDIPLTLDTLTGLAKYVNTSYFPLNDFTVRADGTPNPFNQKDKYGGKNFHFCLETHGEFDYKPGQTFSFTGDDDVYFYVNGKLVVDLGGIHGPQSKSVSLDGMGLVAGKSYPWDFFYCERHTGGSSMQMTTSMNLRAMAEFQIADTLRRPGVTTYDIYLSQLLGQGCAARRETVPTSGLFRITGPGFAQPKALVPGLNFGGIRIDSSLGRIEIDSALVRGLAPGKYQIQVMPQGDTTRIKMASFWIVIPDNPAVARFVAKPAYTGLVGSAVAVQVGSYRNGTADTAVVAFLLPAVPGVAWFRDSLLTSSVLPTDTLRTAKAGKPLKVWARGLVAGQDTLAVADARSGLIDLYPEVRFQERGLRFVDSAGKAYLTLPPVLANVGDTVRIHLEAYVRDSTCAICKDTVLLGPLPAGLVALDPKLNKAITRVVLNKGVASFRLTSSVVLEGGSLKVQTVDSLGGVAQNVLTPIDFVPYRLVFTDSAGVPLKQGWTLDTLILDPVALGLRIEGLRGFCTTCTGRIPFVPGYSTRILDAKGRSLDTVTVTAGQARFTIAGLRVASLDSLVSRATARIATSTLGNLSFRALPPDSAAWYDRDGDGLADSAVVHLHHAWTDSTRIRLAWPDTMRWAALDSGTVRLSSDSMTFTFLPRHGLAGTATRGDSLLGRWSRDQGDWQAFPVADRIAPVAVQARLFWGTTMDTLRIRASEALAGVLSKGDLLRLAQGSGFGAVNQADAWVDSLTGELVLLFPVGDTVGHPGLGDTVRFAPGSGIGDLLGNHPGANSRAVTIEGDDPLPQSAVLSDADGDGRADRIVLRLRTPLQVTKSFRFAWPDREGVLQERILPVSAAAIDAQGLRVTFEGFEPFAFGATSCPDTGCANLGQARDDSGKGGSFPLLDGVNPVVLSGHIVHASGDSLPDTLRIRYSEPVRSSGAGASWANWGVPEEDSLGSVVPFAAAWLDSGNRVGVLVYRPSEEFNPVAGNKVRFPPASAGTLRDRDGNAPQRLTAWVPLTEGARPPRLVIRAYPPVQKLPSYATFDREHFQTLHQDPRTGNWLQANGAVADTAGLSGISLEFTGTFAAKVYFYDMLGVSIGMQDLSLEGERSRAGTLPKDLRGRSRLLVTWDGQSTQGRLVPPGIYLVRIVATVETGKGQEFVNGTVKIGWSR